MKALNKISGPVPLLLCLLSTCCFSLCAAELYREPFRPQFHFTPERNWMNDPNGLVFYDGEFHLFYQHNPFGDKWGHMSWGHAVSPDLCHWQHLPVALAEENGVMIFSGSAVVDWKNTSGFGQANKPPLVAIYTGHYTTKPLQNQHIAYSNDRGRTWTKFSGNPVLDIGEKDFRDPKVIWHEGSRRWVMVAAWPTHRKVRFYSSPNLKSWTHLSDFGPAGSTTGIWECPDLFPLPFEHASKWVLIVNTSSGTPAGGSGCQYFVGDFDGQQFALDASFPKPQPEFVPEGTILGDFEGDDYAGWRATGDAFGQKPARGKIGGQQAVDGFRGRGLVNSFLGGDASEGTLTSPEFTITADYISFLIGGGNHKDKTCINLLIDGTVARTATGDNAERLKWKSWLVHDLREKKATLQIVDAHAGGWGHISVDHIVMADAPARPATEPALWADFGPDFYAAVSWSDLPKSDSRRVWLGWMSNWTYAGDVPTSPWRSAMSIPRELALRRNSEGIRLLQEPARELKKLRARHSHFKGGDLQQANIWLKQNPPGDQSLELLLEFSPLPQGAAGLKLFQGASEETVVGVDRDQARVYLDRTHSGNVTSHPQFPRVYSAPLAARESQVKLHLFLDACSVEIFVNDGEQVLTALAFPSATSTGLEFFGPDSAKVAALDVWSLKSIWK
jgi:beta-fructofuranosidase/levanase/fructan beta-fructosidase